MFERENVVLPYGGDCMPHLGYKVHVTQEQGANEDVIRNKTKATDSGSVPHRSRFSVGLCPISNEHVP